MSANLRRHLDAEDFLKAGRKVQVQYERPEKARRKEEPKALTLT